MNARYLLTPGKTGEVFTTKDLEEIQVVIDSIVTSTIGLDEN